MRSRSGLCHACVQDAVQYKPQGGACDLIIVSFDMCMRRAMQEECNALELELKHHEKGFAELVSEELEQRFMRFEEVTLAAVQKMVGIISAPEAAPVGETCLLLLLRPALALLVAYT